MEPENIPQPNDERLDKVKQIMEVADQGYVKEEDFIQVFDAMKEAMRILREDCEGKVDSNVGYLDDRIDTLEGQVTAIEATDVTQEDLAKVQAEIFALGIDIRNEIETRFAGLEMPDISPLLPRAEYEEDRKKIIAEATQKIPYNNPEELRDALESLEGDERIDISAIKGWEEFKESVEKKVKNKETFYFGTGGGIDPGEGGGISDIGGLIEAGAHISITGSGTEADPYVIAADLTGYATETYVDNAVAALVNSSPAALDTLDELAAALGDDANFATTVTNALATKAADSGVVHNTGNENVGGTKTFTSDVIVPDEAYDATAWNGSMEVPTKNAIRDKIESMGGGPGGAAWGDITGTLSDQSDLQAALDAKADDLGADDNYVTDAEKVKLSNLSGTNTGDQDLTPYFNKSVDDTDDITVGASNKFATAAEKTKLGHISVTQAVDLDTMETQAAAGAAAKVKTDFLTVTQAVDLDDIETRVNALDAAVVLKGTWDASAGTFPGGGTAQAGASYIVSVAGTVDSVAFAVGDRIIAITDNASTGTFASNWFKADYTDQVLSVAGQTGAVTLAKGDVGLGNVDNTSDATKNAAAVALTNKTIDFANNTVSMTKAQLDAAVSDGNVLYVGDITQYTDEMAQDTIGGSLTDSASIDFTYDDTANTITAIVKDDSITYAKMQNVSATARLLGRKTAGAGDPEELTLSEALDLIGSAAQGDILYRGAATWARLGAGTSGHYLKTQGTGANPTWAAVTAVPTAPTIQIFTANGTYTKPAGLVYAIVECQGNGGNGGTTSGGGSGGGGGGGGYTKKVIAAGSIGSTETVTVVAGGGGTGNTSFGSLLTAGGGANASGNSGGAGGSATGGDINVPGQAGQAGNAGAGTVPGNGGNSFLGKAGAAPQGNTSASASFDGQNGFTYGGGGSASGCATDGNPAGTGGSGAGGCVIVTEYY